LIEDSSDEIAAILQALAPVAGREQVEVCRDGIAALDFLHCRDGQVARNPAEMPRLILLDTNLPRLSGLDVLREIRARENTRLLPVTMIASTCTADEVQTACRLGANSFVRKPANLGDLGERIAVIARYWVELNIAPPLTGTME